MKKRFMTAMIAILASAAAQAQNTAIGDFPNRPLRLITGFQPGGVSDTIARVVGGKLGEALGQRVVIDGRPGAGGVLSMGIAAEATPDGYTLYLGQPVMTISRLFKNKPKYDPVKVLAPVSLLGTGPTMLTVHPSMPVNSVKELIAYAKAQPEPLRFGSSGAGTTNHLAGELFRVMGNVPMRHIPYRGAAANALAAIQGEIQIAFLPLAAALTQVKSGRLKGLAVTGARRAVAVPDVPTIGESLPGYRVEAWYGLVVPAATPRTIIDYLSRTTNKVLARADVKETLLKRGVEAEGSTPDELAQLIREDTVKWEKLVKNAGIKFE